MERGRKQKRLWPGCACFLKDCPSSDIPGVTEGQMEEIKLRWQCLATKPYYQNIYDNKVVTRVSYDQRSHQYHLDKEVSDWISENVQRMYIVRLQSTAQDKCEGNQAQHTAQKLQAESKELIEVKYKLSY